MKIVIGKGKMCWALTLVLLLAALGGRVWQELRSERGMCSAAAVGDLKTLGRLLALEIPLDVPGAKGRIPLSCAVRAGQLQAVEILLAVGADPNVPDEGGNVPLYYAVAHNYPQVAARLLAAGADPHWQNDAGESLFFLAAKGDRALVALLQERSELLDKVQVLESDGNLFCAAHSGCLPGSSHCLWSWSQM